jgi:hypothetical protein
MGSIHEKNTEGKYRDPSISEIIEIKTKCRLYSMLPNMRPKVTLDVSLRQ